MDELRSDSRRIARRTHYALLFWRSDDSSVFFGRDLDDPVMFRLSEMLHEVGLPFNVRVLSATTLPPVIVLYILAISHLVDERPLANI